MELARGHCHDEFCGGEGHGEGFIAELDSRGVVCVRGEVVEVKCVVPGGGDEEVVGGAVDDGFDRGSMAA